MNNLIDFAKLKVGEKMEIEEYVIATGEEWMHSVRKEKMTRKPDSGKIKYSFCNYEKDGQAYRLKGEDELNVTQYKNYLKLAEKNEN